MGTMDGKEWNTTLGLCSYVYLAVGWTVSSRAMKNCVGYRFYMARLFTVGWKRGWNRIAIFVEHDQKALSIDHKNQTTQQQSNYLINDNFMGLSLSKDSQNQSCFLAL